MTIYQMLKSGMDATEIRGRVIASNISNINTPGYKRKYVSFEEVFNNTINNSKVNVKEDSSTSIRVDGNNVDLENEKVNQAANSLMYNSFVSITNIKLKMAQNVISGR